MTQTCVFANGGVARTGAHVISHTCVWPMQYYAENPCRESVVLVHAHVCCKSKESVVTVRVAWDVF